MILLNLTLGSRYHFLPENPFITDDLLLQQKIMTILSDIFSRPLCPLHFQFPTTDISIWITTYTCCSYHYSEFLLLLQDASNCSPTFKNPLYHCHVVPCRRNIPTDNSLDISSIHSFPVVLVFHKRLRNTIWSFKNPQQPVVLGILAYLHSG